MHTCEYEEVISGGAVVGCSYYWDGVQVSEEEYYNRYDQYCDRNLTESPYDNAWYDSSAGRYVGNGLCDASEIISTINAY